MESTTKITVELAPFIDSVDKVFTVMLQSTLEQIDVDQLDDEGAAKIVSSTAVIGLKGAAFWTLSRVMPAPTGSAITRLGRRSWQRPGARSSGISRRT